MQTQENTQGVDEKRKNLIALIHIMKNNLNISDEDYRNILYSVTKKRSSKEMTESELKDVARHMSPTKNYFKSKKESVHVQSQKNETGAGADKASDRQVSYIKKLWQSVSNVGTKGALDSFVERTTKKSSVCAISKKEASDVITALMKMQKNKYGGGEK